MPVRDFWVGVKFKQCKCGKKEVLHGFCQDCWDNGGKEKVLATARREYEKLHEERKSVHKKYLKMIMGTA